MVHAISKQFKINLLVFSKAATRYKITKGNLFGMRLKAIGLKVKFQLEF